MRAVSSYNFISVHYQSQTIFKSSQAVMIQYGLFFKCIASAVKSYVSHISVLPSVINSPPGLQGYACSCIAVEARRTSIQGAARKDYERVHDMMPV